MKIVEVTWDDSSESTAWQSQASAARFHTSPCVCVTVGFLLSRDKQAVTVAASLARTNEVGGIWRIPAGIVKKVRVLGTSKGAA